MTIFGDIIARLKLHRSILGWRGDCPLCCKNDSLVVTEHEGAAIGECSACHDKVGIASLLGGMSRVLAPVP